MKRPFRGLTLYYSNPIYPPEGWWPGFCWSENPRLRTVSWTVRRSMSQSWSEHIHDSYSWRLGRNYSENKPPDRAERLCLYVQQIEPARAQK